MSAPDHPDPWASLADSLGVGPGGEPERQPAPPPPARTPPRPADRPKPKPAAPAASWDDLASDLGIAPGAGEPADRAAEPPRPAARPPRHDDRPPRRDVQRDDVRRDDVISGDDGARERRRPPFGEGETSRDSVRGDRRDRDREGGRDRVRDEDRRDRDDRPARDESLSTRDDAAGEGRGGDGDERRGRRRRGRRGGRRRREQDDVARTGDAPAAREGDEFDPRPADRAWPDDEARPPREAAEGGSPDAGRDRPAADGDDDRPRRRRRRGRRGGRGRAREGGEARSDTREPGVAAAKSAGNDDEPLPTSYGMRPARPNEGREQAGDGDRPRRDGASGTGSSRGRRRRRRGGEERPAGAGRSSGDGGRRSRRSRDERGSSSRVRRADFAPVSGGYDEDDEGLDFLGVEEASRDATRRPAQAVSDDVLEASGLAEVRDVPSWVEAIGIVIAGNLDARNRGRGEGGRRDR